MPPLVRRKFLSLGLHMPLVFIAARSSAACVDPDEMSDNEQGMRESMEYTDQAPAAQLCTACAHFQPLSAADNCGSCEILGGRVSAGGYCVSWTRRD